VTELARPLHHHSFADYLDLEETSTVRHEYLAGEIYAMAGGTPGHAALAVAVSTALSNQLGASGCHVFSSDLRVRILATGLATYPDVTVVCGRIARDPDSPTHVTNPTLLVEVTSDGTEDYDRGEKLEHYQKIASLRACVIVSHRAPRLEVVHRTAEASWQRTLAGAGEQIEIPGLACQLVVDDLYRGVLGAL